MIHAEYMETYHNYTSLDYPSHDWNEVAHRTKRQKTSHGVIATSQEAIVLSHHYQQVTAARETPEPYACHAQHTDRSLLTAQWPECTETPTARSSISPGIAPTTSCDSIFPYSEGAARRDVNSYDGSIWTSGTVTGQDVYNLMSIKEETIERVELPRSSGADEVVCYGMVNTLNLESTDAQEITQDTPAQWNGTKHLQDPYHGSNIVQLTQQTYDLCTVLSEQAQVSLQFWLREPPGRLEDDGQWQQQPHDNGVGGQIALSAILYGPLHMAIIVGDWLDSAKLFLQMPRGCFWDVKYKNPHCLSFGEEPCSTTGDLKLTDVFPEAHCETSKQDRFLGLYTDDIYEEAQQPLKISSPMHAHQKAALSFLLDREKGWNFDGSRSGIWKQQRNSFGATKYRNNLSGAVQSRPPPEFRGGILADEMGLGKTCTMLSLIASDDDRGARTAQLGGLHSGACFGTLVVAPFALLQVWEKQIQEHSHPESMKWKVFHGSNRNATEHNLADWEIVITTYNTVALEWRHHNSARNTRSGSQLFSTAWHRIVLDEAHVIRNRSTLVSKAVCALPSNRRWCITGTPIQNRLGDLFGLLRFLGVEPYNHYKNFESDVLRPWRSHNDQVALKRLLCLMKAIAIRRPRNIIALPEKLEITEVIEFSSSERSVYEHVREGAINVLDAAATNNQSVATTYFNALQRINEMRHVCNHGVRPLKNQNLERASSSKHAYSPQGSVDEADEAMELSDFNCKICGIDIQEEDEEDDKLLDLLSPPLTYQSSSPSRQICKLCCQQPSSQDKPPSPLPYPPSIESSFSPPLPAYHQSSKLTALLHHIQQIPNGEKSVVFSYWTSTLAAASQVLTSAGILNIQYDGKLSRAQRTQALTDFATNPSILVFLVSITCGGQGLDLTAANHAFLLEPQWNPMLEEQAMSRVHRLGQTKPVRLIRFVVRATWEEKIRVLQQRKRNLVDLIVERRDLKDGDEGRKQLHFLRELIS